MNSSFSGKNQTSTLSTSLEGMPVKVLLVDDQRIVAEAIRRMLEDQPDVILHYCSDPAQALKVAAETFPTVILQDLVMPEIDGLMLVRYFRANPQTKDIPMIVLSTKEEPKVKAEAFALGANDYIVKLPDKVELLARIRYHSAGYVRLLERNQAYEKLEENQKVLNAELSEAADYVKSLLPLPLKGVVSTSWRFIPSKKLGGDAFGYHWLDPDHFAIYLLDVCGHGVGAALLSVSVINVLRSQTLPDTDFHNPGEVLEALNDSFQMEKHNSMFFTIWYGVFNKVTRQLVYSSGGHPPAILIAGPSEKVSQLLKLGTPNLVIGAMPGTKFEQQSCQVDVFNKLFLFSDGVYEIAKTDGIFFQYQEFVDLLENSSRSSLDDLDRILRQVLAINMGKPFADDFSLIQATFQ